MLPGDAHGGCAVQPRNFQLVDGRLRSLLKLANGSYVLAGHDVDGHRMWQHTAPNKYLSFHIQIDVLDLLLLQEKDLLCI